MLEKISKGIDYTLAATAPVVALFCGYKAFESATTHSPDMFAPEVYLELGGIELIIGALSLWSLSKSK